MIFGISKKNYFYKVMVNNDLHEFYLGIAYNIAYNNLGLTYPNPSVGAVIVKNGRIVAKAVTDKSGGSHAEYNAIMGAGAEVLGADLYVTLEPCCHYGKNPPCTKAIIESGIKNVFYSFVDPNPLVSGLGVKTLESYGIKCHQIALGDDSVYQGFFSQYKKGKPFVTLKLATSLDMKLALSDGSSKWITGEISRCYGHFLRRINDITLTGSGTVINDNPSYNCRLNDAKRTHLAVLDSGLNITQEAKIFAPGNHEKIIVFYDKALQDEARLKRYECIKNVELVGVSKGLEGLDLKEVMNCLVNKNYSSVLVEAGNTLSASLVQAKMVDLFYIFSSGKILGKSAIDAFDILSPDRLINCSNLSLFGIKTLGQDILRILKPEQL